MLLLKRLIEHTPRVRLIERDLALECPRHVGAELYLGRQKLGAERTPAEAQAVRTSNAMIDQLNWADILVIGAPMYNFGFPSVLKSWLDNVSIAGRTFRRDRNGRLHGLVTGKKAYVLTSRGGEFGNGSGEAGNFADSHLRLALDLLGIRNVHVIAADGQALHPDARRVGFDLAVQRIRELIPG